MVSLTHAIGLPGALLVLLGAALIGLAVRLVGTRRGWFTAARNRAREDRIAEPARWITTALMIALAALAAFIPAAPALRVALPLAALATAAAFVALALRARRIVAAHRRGEQLDRRP